MTDDFGEVYLDLADLDPHLLHRTCRSLGTGERVTELWRHGAAYVIAQHLRAETDAEITNSEIVLYPEEARQFLLAIEQGG